MLVGAAVLMAGLTAYGWTTLTVSPSNGLALTPETLAGEIVRSWMTVFLFAGIFAALLYTRDAGSGGLARSVLAAGSRQRLFAVKMAAATIVGLGFGVLAVVGAVGSTFGLARWQQVDIEWTSEVTWTALGVFLTCPLAALFGLAVGMIVRNTAGAIGVLLVTTLLLEPGLQRLAPEQAKYLFTIALSGVYRDHGQVLSMASGAITAGLWIAVLAIVARYRLMTRDVT
ncbi:MAG: ABC transporter permease [Actinomycetales bacterium]|nr:MAG: ABC transporter permease [Actinomycetales bacterium]